MSIERDIILAIGNNGRTRDDVKDLIEDVNLTASQNILLEEVKKKTIEIEDMLMELLKEVR